MGRRNKRRKIQNSGQWDIDPPKIYNPGFVYFDKVYLGFLEKFFEANFEGLDWTIFIRGLTCSETDFEGLDWPTFIRNWYETDNMKRVLTFSISSLTYSDKHSLTTLPREIGRLKNLECLDLCHTRNLSALPVEIGKLTALRKLNLRWSGIYSLPNSIGYLKNLTHLDLLGTKNLSYLPEEIKYLNALKILTVSCSGIRALPDCIGCLLNLDFEEFNLSDMIITNLPPLVGWRRSIQTLNLSHSHVTQLPEDIGTFSRLTVMNLSYSSITSLPASIGKLQNLEWLNLFNTNHLSELPREIGNLKTLKKFTHSSVKKKSLSLPSLVFEMTGLMYLKFDCNDITFLLKLAKRCKSLGAVGYFSEWKSYKLRYELACNRVRFKIGAWFLSGVNQSIPSELLWPGVLANTRKVFEHYSDPGWFFYTDSECIEKSDAIYQLLDDGRGSFLELLVERNRKVARVSNNK